VFKIQLAPVPHSVAFPADTRESSYEQAAQFGCLSFHEYCRIHHEFCHQRSASSYLVPDLNLHACSRLWHRSAWRMRRDVSMQTICQVIMEKREGDGEMMQGTKEGKNGRKKKNRKMKINK